MFLTESGCSQRICSGTSGNPALWINIWNKPPTLTDKTQGKGNEYWQGLREFCYRLTHRYVFSATELFSSSAMVLEDCLCSRCRSCTLTKCCSSSVKLMCLLWILQSLSVLPAFWPLQQTISLPQQCHIPWHEMLFSPNVICDYPGNLWSYWSLICLARMDTGSSGEARYLQAAWGSESRNQQNASRVSSLTLKMEELHYSEMSVDVYQTVWCHIQEDSTLCSHCYESLKSSELIINFETSSHHLRNTALREP